MMNINLKVLAESKEMSKRIKRGKEVVRTWLVGETITYHIEDLDGDILEEGTFPTISALTKRFDARGWEAEAKEEVKPVETKKEAPKKEVKPAKATKKETKKETTKKKATKKEAKSNQVTLKEIIDELRESNSISEMTMKKVRRILRQSKDKSLNPVSKEGDSFRWEWSIEDKEAVKENIRLKLQNK